VWRAYGVKGLYRGGLLNVLRAAPSQAVQFFVFDQLKSSLGS
jgi:ornithine carrier protein